ncbi:tetratricopeptide repeat protein, partial [Salmonella enterica]|nr:tetratricopeptide repeat protein [Salmonella enterica subsp. salamae]EEP0974997.1 tetratricopeptide repeat protein [Salmonella enterica]EEP1007260.1 tetratricopeptide repeat protein [Salmonella enterica]EEP1021058.1 tetratricopeptide repeat protein [Salmonella enterica]EEP1035024.1 tetratricopeptide repeat protein [Salmonella enterica]
CFLDIIQNAQTDNEYTFKAHGNLGVLYKNTGRIDEAIFHLERSSASSFKRIDSIIDLKSLNNLGACYHNSNRSDEAIDVLKKALTNSITFLEKSTSKNEKQDIKSLQANIYTNIAISLKNIYLKDNINQHLYDAEEYLSKAISIEETLGNDNLLGRHYGNLSAIYRLLNDNDNYKKYALLSFDIFRYHGSEKEKLVSELNEGLFYNVNKEFDKALKQFNSLLNNPNIGKYPKLKALTLINATYTYDSLDNPEKAQALIIRARDISIKHKLTREMEYIKRECQRYFNNN